MLKVLLYIAVVAAAAAGFAWLADRPGELVLFWQGTEIRTSLMISVIAMLIVVVLVILLWVLIRSVFLTPKAMTGFFRNRRRDRGYAALSRGMIAIGAGDSRLAGKAARESGRLLAGEPLTQLLEAQAAQLSGDHAAARAAFEAMLDDPATRLLGLHGLFVEAERAGDHTAARHYAERASTTAPQLPWAGEAMFAFQSAEGDWEGALRSLQRNADNKLIDRDVARRQRAVLLTAEAMGLEDTDPNRARSLAVEAHGMAPDLVPAAVVASRLYTQANDIKRATKIIETTWKLSPHPDLAEVYAHARPGDSARDRLKRVKALAQKRAHHVEGSLAVARAAIDAKEWAEARSAIEIIVRSAPTVRACMLMAEIEEGEYGDRGRVREWLSRALRAPRDPAWTADGYVAEAWAPVSPITGRIDAFEWRVPVEQLAGPTDLVVDDDLVAPMVFPDEAEDVTEPLVIDAKPAVEPAVKPAAGPAEPAEPAAAKPAVVDAGAEPEARPSPDATATAEAKPATGDKPSVEAKATTRAEPASAAKPADKGDMVRFPLEHAPDDPGPEPTGSAPSGGFRLF
ncbi:MAG: heme biosynthesis HemY N-terminal domain-containing protein [Hyphomicrobiales bacterium]